MNYLQFGSTAGRQCQSAILSKVLLYDLMRLQRSEGATAKFDTSSCYDRIISALLVVSSMRIGLGVKAADMLYESLQNVSHA